MSINSKIIDKQGKKAGYRHKKKGSNFRQNPYQNYEN